MFTIKLLSLNDNRIAWTYEEITGNWLLFFGTATLKQHVFVFTNNTVSNYYVKKTGSKTGIFYPTVVAEPIF